jgi:hypothetical protein
MRTVYAARRDTLVRALAEHAPEVELTGLAAGLHAVARLPAGLEEEAVISAARSRSIGLYGMSEYRSSGATRPPELVLGFGNVSEEAVDSASPRSATSSVTARRPARAARRPFRPRPFPAPRCCLQLGLIRGDSGRFGALTARRTRVKALRESRGDHDPLGIDRRGANATQIRGEHGPQRRAASYGRIKWRSPNSCQR